MVVSVTAAAALAAVGLAAAVAQVEPAVVPIVSFASASVETGFVQRKTDSLGS